MGELQMMGEQQMMGELAPTAPPATGGEKNEENSDEMYEEQMMGELQMMGEQQMMGELAPTAPPATGGEKNEENDNFDEMMAGSYAVSDEEMAGNLALAGNYEEAADSLMPKFDEGLPDGAGVLDNENFDEMYVKQQKMIVSPQQQIMLQEMALAGNYENSLLPAAAAQSGGEYMLKNVVLNSAPLYSAKDMLKVEDSSQEDEEEDGGIMEDVDLGEIPEPGHDEHEGVIPVSVDDSQVICEGDIVGSENFSISQSLLADLSTTRR